MFLNNENNINTDNVKINITIKTTVLLAFLLVSGCASVDVADIEPGEKPANDTDVAGLWYQSERAEKSLKFAANRVFDEEYEGYLKSLLCRMSKTHCQDVRIYILEQPYFNAYMMPNGTMAVWSGLILRAKNEAQLSFVLGHELGHYVKQHSIQNYRAYKNSANAAILVTLVNPALGSLASIAASGSVFSYSRQFEREADSYAATLVHNVGATPKDGADLFNTLRTEQQANKNENKGGFFATHPATSERIDALKNNAEANFKLVKSDTEPMFFSLKKRYLKKWLSQEIKKRDYAATEILLKQLQADSKEPRFYDYYFAELYRRRGDEGDLSLAESHYSSHTQYAEPIAESFSQLGDILKVKEPDKAASYYRQFLNRFPDHKNAIEIQQQLNNLGINNE